MSSLPPPIEFHPSWPEAARAGVLRAIDRHGGWSLWSRLQAVTISLVSVDGWLPRLKGFAPAMHRARTVTAYPKTWRAEWGEDREAGNRGIFDRGDVRLVDPSGAVCAESLAHRRTFRGLRKLRRWSRLDAYYFFGYAFATYAAVPFILPGLVFCGSVSARWRGEPLEGVTVEFPPDLDVHSRRQSFLFDGTGLLRRIDYVAEVVGAWAVGAHGCHDYTTVDGLALPTHRLVVWRFGLRAVNAFEVLNAHLDGFVVRFQ